MRKVASNLFSLGRIELLTTLAIRPTITHFPDHWISSVFRPSDLMFYVCLTALKAFRRFRVQARTKDVLWPWFSYCVCMCVCGTQGSRERGVKNKNTFKTPFKDFLTVNVGRITSRFSKLIDYNRYRWQWQTKCVPPLLYTLFDPAATEYKNPSRPRSSRELRG